MIKKVLKVGAIVLVLGVASGCASQTQLLMPRKLLQTMQQETPQQQNLPQKPLAQQQTAQHKLLQALKALQIRHSQQQQKHKLAATRTAIAWNACSREVTGQVARIY